MHWNELLTLQIQVILTNHTEYQRNESHNFIAGVDLVYLVYFEGEKTFSVYGRPLFEAWRKVSWIRDGILLNIIQLRNLGILVKI